MLLNLTGRKRVERANRQSLATVRIVLLALSKQRERGRPPLHSVARSRPIHPALRRRCGPERFLERKNDKIVAQEAASIFSGLHVGTQTTGQQGGVDGVICAVRIRGRKAQLST